MADEKIITSLPRKSRLPETPIVAIYARVSSTSPEQLTSLSDQASMLVRYAYEQSWQVYDIFIDVHTSKVGSTRSQLNRMVDMARAGLIDILLVKDISRLGRDTLTVLQTVNIMYACDVRVVFLADGLDTYNDDDRVIIEVTEAIMQAKNEQQAEAVKWGHRKRAEQGISKLYNRPVFGYEVSKTGELSIVPRHAEVVKLIFKLYLSGESFRGIIKELEKLKIKSPSGKDKWNQGTIDKTLRNEKYTGNVVLLLDTDSTEAYKIENHHDPIVSQDIFDAAQLERAKRTNVENGKRKSTKYSSKRKAED